MYCFMTVHAYGKTLLSLERAEEDHRAVCMQRPDSPLEFIKP